MDELGGKKEHGEDWDGREGEGNRGGLHTRPLCTFRGLSTSVT